MKTFFCLTAVVFLLAANAACNGSGGGDSDGAVEDAWDGGDAVPDGSDGAPDAGDQATPPPKPYLGVLQFDIRHNLEDDSCVARGDCNLTIENQDDTAGWLARFREVSNLAVLHWDRTVPWLVFDQDPPQGTSRLDFYDSRLDPELLAWIDAFRDHFLQMPRKYLSVTPLDGSRTRLSPGRVDPDTDEVETSGVCPLLGPGMVIEFEYDPGTGPVTASFDLERSYRNFTMYLYDKLQPDYLAIMIEVNMFKEACPGQWSQLVQLYRSVYDAVRAEVDPEVQVFATLTFQELLKYQEEACVGQLAVEDCSGEPTPPGYPDPDPETCFPLDLTAIQDLDQGDRLEILALSFYPDALMMAVGEDNLVYFYPEDWDGVSDCIMRVHSIPFCDPFAALDRFGWQKPVAVAELGARSCRTFGFIDDGSSLLIVKPIGDSTSQAFWLDHSLETAEQRGFEFYVQVFLRDYPPLGLWTVQSGPFDPWTYNAFNAFPCMGIQDEAGGSKGTVTDIWMNHLP